MKLNLNKTRKIWFSLSVTLVSMSLACLSIFGLNLGLDFSGGVRVDIQFTAEEKVEVEKIREFFTTQSLKQSPKIQISGKNTFLVTIESLPDERLEKILIEIKNTLGDFEISSLRRVDSVIGSNFKNKSLWSIFYTLVGIIIFIAWSFRRIPKTINPWRFGVIAILALTHDIILLLGIFSLLGFLFGTEIGLPFITALLATLGFSVNDTIVIFDRIRENIRSQKPHETFNDTVEKSIQQTFFRSIATSFSTLLPLIALIFFGATTLFYFVLALAIGIFIGTYSSVFLAAPLLATWKDWADKR